jgi:hypothetical protein
VARGEVVLLNKSLEEFLDIAGVAIQSKILYIQLQIVR